MGSIHTLGAVPGRYAFVCRVEYLPDLTSDPGRFGGLGNPIIEGYARQLAFLRALTAHASGTCSLQLRFLARQHSPDPIDILILGTAQGVSQAHELLEFVQNLMPSEVPIRVIEDEEEAVRLWLPFGESSRFTSSTFAEIRRATEPLDPTPDASRTGAYDYVLLDWGWSAHSLTHSLELMRQQRGTTLLGITVQPTSVHPEVYSYLTDGVTAFQEQLHSAWENPLVQTARNVYFDRARRLRQAALLLRVFIASDQPLMAGAPEFFGADLSRRSDSAGLNPQAFEVVRPGTDHDCRDAKSMVEALESPIWGCPIDADENLQELTFIVDPLEAHTAFRIPLTPAGGLAGVATSRLTSFSRGHHVSATDAREGRIIKLGASASIGQVSITAQDVNEHILVAGVPGSGKSTTVRSIVRQLAERGVPFLVLDPAKTDYAELSDIALSYELSPEHVGFNPLAVPENCSVRGHQSRILAALDSGLRLSERWPMGRIIAGLALAEAYAAADAPERAPRYFRWPSLAELYRHARAVIAQQGLSGEVLDSVKGSLLSRLEFLVEGPLGDVLSGDAGAGIDWRDLTATSAVIQMRSIAGPDERALVFGLLLAGVVGYREANPYGSADKPELGHVTVLEEAHRLLANDAASSYSAQLFSDAIAELRGSGEGFIVVDQAPSLLIPGVSKMTGTKITHRLTDSAEREFVGEAMVLTPGQTQDVSRLARGFAIVQAGSIPEPTLMQVELAGSDGNAGPSASAIADDTHRLYTGLAQSGPPVRPWCQQCPRPCEADPTPDQVQTVTATLSADTTEAGLKAYVHSAAEALGIALPQVEISEVMRLYCVTAKALSDSYDPHDRHRRIALGAHRRVSDKAVVGK